MRCAVLGRGVAGTAGFERDRAGPVSECLFGEADCGNRDGWRCSRLRGRGTEPPLAWGKAQASRNKSAS
jgi:hypothetical protein